MVDKLRENSIIPIFAVRQEQLNLYRNATDQLFRGGTVEVLERDSENILDLIEKAYNRITQKQHLLLKTSKELHKDAFCLGTEALYQDEKGKVRRNPKPRSPISMQKSCNHKFFSRAPVRKYGIEILPGSSGFQCQMRPYQLIYVVKNLFS